MKVKDVLGWLDGLAPFDSAEDFDNVGAASGRRGKRPCAASRSGMDVTEALVDEALAHGDGLIVTHHPFIFHALKRINYHEPQGRTLLKLTANRVCVIAAHTNWDKAPGGISDSLAQALGLTDVSAPGRISAAGHAFRPAFS